jgi:hypothetical protein
MSPTPFSRSDVAASTILSAASGGRSRCCCAKFSKPLKFAVNLDVISRAQAEMPRRAQVQFVSAVRFRRSLHAIVPICAGAEAPPLWLRATRFRLAFAPGRSACRLTRLKSATEPIIEAGADKMSGKFPVFRAIRSDRRLVELGLKAKPNAQGPKIR